MMGRMGLHYLIAGFMGFLMLSGCESQQNAPARVTFQQSERTITTELLIPVVFDLRIDPPSMDSSQVFIDVSTSGGEIGVAFETSPPISNGLLTLPVPAGAEMVSFVLYPLEAGLGFRSLIVDFEIIETGSGLVADGLNGVFSSLIILNTRDPIRQLPFQESFNGCEEETGDGSLPFGWEEYMVKQNSLGTGRWECGSTSFGLVCNAYSADGKRDDDCEVWLVTPPISLMDESDPTMSFWADRRFDSDNYQEYEVRISNNYTGMNFEEADWTLFDQAVAFIESNDPDLDDYEKSDPFPLSAFEGDTITLAWIYRSKGSGLSATILRIDDVEIRGN